MPLIALSFRNNAAPSSLISKSWSLTPFSCYLTLVLNSPLSVRTEGNIGYNDFMGSIV